MLIINSWILFRDTWADKKRPRNTFRAQSARRASTLFVNRYEKNGFIYNKDFLFLSQPWCFNIPYPVATCAGRAIKTKLCRYLTVACCRLSWLVMIRTWRLFSNTIVRCSFVQITSSRTGIVYENVQESFFFITRKTDLGLETGANLLVSLPTIAVAWAWDLFWVNLTWKTSDKNYYWSGGVWVFLYNCLERGILVRFNFFLQFVCPLLRKA